MVGKVFLTEQLVLRGKAGTPVITSQKYCTLPAPATPSAVPNVVGGKGMRGSFLLFISSFCLYFLLLFSYRQEM